MAESIFVVSWCNKGLESVIPVTVWEREEIMAVLASKPYTKRSISETINMLTLRARLNSQRHYEIYAFTAVDGITEEDIREMFDDAPQEAADTIRRIGQRIYSDRAVPGKIKIT